MFLLLGNIWVNAYKDTTIIGITITGGTFIIENFLSFFYFYNKHF